jgi:hypothetical protein
MEWSNIKLRYLYDDKARWELLFCWREGKKDTFISMATYQADLLGRYEIAFVTLLKPY